MALQEDKDITEEDQHIAFLQNLDPVNENLDDIAALIQADQLVYYLAKAESCPWKSSG